MIFLVKGQTGEYEDRQDWIVKAFKQYDNARMFADDMNAQAKRMGVADDKAGSLSYTERDAAKKTLQEWDSQVSIDYTGVEYIVEAVSEGD